MPVEDADDLAAFFNAEEFGTSATFVSAVAGTLTIAILRVQPDEEVPHGSAATVMPSNIVQIMRSAVERPVKDDRLFIVEFDEDFGRMLEHEYRIIGTPALDDFDTIWECELARVV